MLQPLWYNTTVRNFLGGGKKVINRAELKQQAKNLMKGKIGALFVVLLVFFVISIAILLIPSIMRVSELRIVAMLGGFLFIVAILALVPLVVGFLLVYLDVAKGESVEVRRLFDGFNYFGKAVVLMFLMSVFTCLWTLLFIVPGIIKVFSYSMAFYILAENPDISPLEALNESKSMMDGHKWEYFLLSLSFILWYLLCGVTCGIAYVYVLPYVYTTTTLFYLNLKGDNTLGATATTMEM